MITMKTGSKTPVKFTFSDDVSETVITVFSDDPSEVIAAKLQRVLELEGYAATPQRAPLPIASGEPSFTPADRAAYDERLERAGVMGWGEDIDIDSLPEK